MSVTGNKMRTDCSPCRRRFRYRRIRWDTWEQERADAFESVLISSPRKWGLRVAHNALSLRQADRADSEDHVAIDKQSRGLLGASVGTPPRNRFHRGRDLPNHW